MAFFFIMALSSPFGGKAFGQTNPFDGLNLGDLDLGDLVVVTDDPLSAEVLESIELQLPLDLSGEDPILVLLIDPDGEGTGEPAFALPISLGDLLTDPGTGDPLTGSIPLADELISSLDLDLIPGLSDLLDGLLGGLLGTILSGGDEGDLISLLDILDGLGEDSVITAIGIDALVDSLGLGDLELVSILNEENELTITLLPEDTSDPQTTRFQPDLRIGRTANSQSHLGNNIYSGALGQKLKVRTNSRRSKVFASIENDGRVQDGIAGASNSGRKRLFKTKAVDLSFGGNVTAALRTGRYFRTLRPGQVVTIRFKDKLKNSAVGRRNKIGRNQLISVRSANDPARIDSAKVRKVFKIKN